MLPQFKYGTFTTTSGPAAVNVDLGFIPDEFEAWECDASANEQIFLKFLLTAGSGKGWTGKVVVDTGTYAASSLTYVASSHIATWLQDNTVTPGPWKASTVYAVGDVVHPRLTRAPTRLSVISWPARSFTTSAPRPARVRR